MVAMHACMHAVTICKQTWKSCKVVLKSSTYLVIASKLILLVGQPWGREQAVRKVSWKERQFMF